MYTKSCYWLQLIYIQIVESPLRSGEWCVYIRPFSREFCCAIAVYCPLQPLFVSVVHFCKWTDGDWWEPTFPWARLGSLAVKCSLLFNRAWHTIGINFIWVWVIVDFRLSLVAEMYNWLYSYIALQSIPMFYSEASCLHLIMQIWRRDGGFWYKGSNMPHIIKISWIEWTRIAGASGYFVWYQLTNLICTLGMLHLE